MALTLSALLTRLQMQQLFGVKKTEKKEVPAIETLKMKLEGCVSAGVGGVCECGCWRGV